MILLSFERLKHHHYQSTENQTILALDKDERLKQDTFFARSALPYGQNDAISYFTYRAIFGNTTSGSRTRHRCLKDGKITKKNLKERFPQTYERIFKASKYNQNKAILNVFTTIFIVLPEFQIN